MPTLLCLGIASIPVVWFARETWAAGQGEVSPAAAVTVYLYALSNGEELGVRRVLADGRRDELFDQWSAYRAEIERGQDLPSRLTWGAATEQVEAEGRAAVTVDVAGVWSLPDAPVGSSILRGESHPWHFEARRDRGGWRIWSASLPAWCGAHVRADTCA
ncbi:hypothetical protein J2S43_006809 [Catenuloplanes nepalensis]|uniref:Nuclear transport factor 2 family protein n=1 Tax=Catenuloplanes nepalensis TaxID=587533 RepID=A0ABT9N3L4_9ACTN|nr:hypothetical protein [Catenuloplanes nepalensis]MDP9798297.1 hypothetical protein [Catenuloplanes nepalensis]